MPERTKEEREFIDSLPIRSPDKQCNARTPNNEEGYCKLPAGYGTDHLGEGRCKYHGGSAGRPIVHGLYSSKLPSTVRDEFDKLSKNPQLVDLNQELALVKTLLSNFLKNIETKLEDEDSNWWVQKTKKGKDISAEAKALMKLLETLSKIYTRIASTEIKVSNNLSIRDVYLIINQFKVTLNDTCGSCPIRQTVSKKIGETKMAEVVSVENEE